MNQTKSAIFITIYRILVKGKKHYAGPSVDAIIGLISKRHDTSIHRRWAFQCLHDLTSEEFITRRVRYIQRSDRGFKQIPSLISITLKGARKLFDMGVDGASRLIKEILDWVHAGDKRWPQYENGLNSPATRISTGAPVNIGKIFASLGLFDQPKEAPT